MKKENRKKNQNKSWLFKGRFLIGVILISVGVIILLSSFFWYLAFLILVGGLLFVVFTGITIEMLKIFWVSEFTGKRLIAALYMAFYTYLSLFLFLLLMVFSEQGNFIFVLIIAPAAISDGTAFTVGKKKGKNKIAKRISPGKTVRGTIAGYLASFAATLIILVFLFPRLELWQILLVSALLPLLAFLGDLIESGYKRIMGVKDTGSIFKGHGGVLDRVDSFLLPIYAIFLLTFWFL